MGIFFALILIVGIAVTAHHSDTNETPTIEQPAPCPPKMAEPRMRDLTVAFEKRIYLLPSGKTCGPRALAAPQIDTTSEQRTLHDLHATPSDG